MQMSAAAAAKERRERMASPHPSPPALSSCPGVGGWGGRSRAIRASGGGAMCAASCNPHPPRSTNGSRCVHSPRRAN